MISKSVVGPLFAVGPLALSTNQIPYRYDGIGRRVEKNVGNNITRFVFDGRSVIADVVTTANNFQTYYLSGVGYVRGGVQTYLQENALGSAVLEVYTTGGLVSRREYDAYGKESNILVGTNTPFRFAGKHGYQTDLESGFDLLDARFYLPGVGRFLTQDPIGQKGGLNLYAYCDNNPLSRIDPLGTDNHNPGIVTVSGEFRGRVFAIGEPDLSWGERQTMVWVKAGYVTNPNMDVDLLYIMYPDGAHRFLFLMGTKNKTAETISQKLGLGGNPRSPQNYFVDKNGDVHGANIVDIEPGSSGIGVHNWVKDMNSASLAGNACPKNRLPQPGPCFRPGSGPYGCIRDFGSKYHGKIYPSLPSSKS